MTTRYVILGAGAVGGVLAARLDLAGFNTAIIARGAHGKAIQSQGLTLRTPDGEIQRKIPCSLSPLEFKWSADDVLILGTKSQDAESALESVPEQTPIICSQNGVTTEPMAQERFHTVYGMMTWIPGQHLEPGLVELYAPPPHAVLRIGLYPKGKSAAATAYARDLKTAGFDAVPVRDIRRWKYAKLITNLGNVIDAYCIKDDTSPELIARAQLEAETAVTAANIDYIPPKDFLADMLTRIDFAQISGTSRGGGSTWQSATRNLPTEVPYLNGYICALAKQHNTKAPINETLLALASRNPPPRSVPMNEL